MKSNTSEEVRMFTLPATKKIRYKLVLLCVLGVPAYGGLIVPGSQWGSGNATGHAYVQAPNYIAPIPNSHTTNCFLNATVSTCNLGIASNVAPDGNPYHDQNTGTSDAYVHAVVDGAGAHLKLTADGTGESSASVDGSVFFGDYVTNTTASTAQYQLGLHLDAFVYGLEAGYVTFGAGFSEPNGGFYLGQASFYNTGAGAQYSVSQDFLTELVSVAPNSTSYWSVSMSGTLAVASSPNVQYLVGTPYGYVNAGNTLSITSFSAFDAGGNPIPVSTFSSADGFDYSASTSAAPEPGSMGMLCIGLGCVGLAVRKRLSATA
jgi:hypothetical protein